jgi:hypothetical protein
VRAIVLFILLGCNSSNQGKSSAAPSFTRAEVVGALNALTAIVDWPADTKQTQTNLNLTPEEAQKLISPLHPLWDEKLTEAALEMQEWNKDQVKAVSDKCAATCECDFFQLALEKHPESLHDASEELKSFAGLKFGKTKPQVLNCLEKLPPLGNLLKYLHEEAKKFQADSVI